MIGIYSSGIRQIPYLQSFLGEACCKLSHFSTIPHEVSAIAVWGERPSSQRPIEQAQKLGLPVLRLEDGFIRSLGLGIRGTPPLGIVIDDLGIYYNASYPSRLEVLIQQETKTLKLQKDALRAIAFIVDNDISKYNHSITFAEDSHRDVTLVIDQTYGDVSVALGGANEKQFAAMLSCAKREHPKSEIWVKTHPDVLTGQKKGYFDSLGEDPRIRLITEDYSPQSLLRHVSRVYTVTSQYGIEALLAGKSVTCFGQPWYSGWGLTDDRHPLAGSLRARRGNAPLTALVAAALLQYTRYIDPYNGTRSTLFNVLNYLHLNRKHRLVVQGDLWAPGMTLWKGSIVKPFIKAYGNTVSFSRKCKKPTACVVWGIKGEKIWTRKATQYNIPIWRMEDGFLRSAGLGSDLRPPLSLVLDKTGIYYDTTRSSDLENFLNNSHLTSEQQIRAKNLQQQLISTKVSKYNLGAIWSLPDEAKSKKTILVTGQVENDASIATGTRSINTNLMLLRTVHERNPDAYIIYKPHPDVLVGNRPGLIKDDDIEKFSHCVATNADIIECIRQVDEVHTMTSLSGFEALVHGKKVYCYGLPFYAGWGLTTDEYKCERRIKKINIHDLIYHVMITYPIYIHPINKNIIDIEQAIEFLINEPRKSILNSNPKSTRLRRYIRKAINLYQLKMTNN